MRKQDFTVFENEKWQEIALFEHIMTNAEVMKPVEVPAVLSSRIAEQKEANVLEF